MLARSTKAVVAVFAVFELVLTLDVVPYAATGDSLVLGEANKWKKTTVIKSTGKGAALSLKTGPGAAPLAVSNGNRGFRLNADRVDGLDGSTLSSDTQRYTYGLPGPHSTSATFSTPEVAPGTYLVTLRVSTESAADATSSAGSSWQARTTPATWCTTPGAMPR